MPGRNHCRPTIRTEARGIVVTVLHAASAGCRNNPVNANAKRRKLALNALFGYKVRDVTADDLCGPIQCQSRALNEMLNLSDEHCATCDDAITVKARPFQACVANIKNQKHEGPLLKFVFGDTVLGVERAVTGMYALVHED